MRRRTRVDLGQQTSSAKEETILDRKRKRWAERNKDKDPEENPFLLAIKPDQANFGEEDERGEELRKRLSNLEFGNFPGYFNYRNKASVQDTRNDGVKSPEQSGDNQAEKQQDATTAAMPAESSLESGMSDERLKFFKPEWFAGKEVLDIGCNRGHITYAVARLYNPASIVGIDIDAKMINMANKDLHLHLEDGIISVAKEELRQKAIRQGLQDGNDTTVALPLSSYINDGPLIRQEGKHSAANSGGELERSQGNEETESRQAAGTTDANKFPNNIVFVEHNYVLSRDELVQKQRPHFDTIVCLSVTKWIHLNYCDSGLKRFFKRIYKHLRPGGLLILETQPFDNYGRRKKLSDRLKANFYSIQFKPDQFDEYLLSPEVGFQRIVYESVTDHQCAGFKRPLKVFLK